MLTALWTKTKALWATVQPFLILILAAAFMLEKHEADKDDEKLLTAKTDAKDVVLAAQGSALEADSAKTVVAATEEKKTELTPDEMTKFLNGEDK